MKLDLIVKYFILFYVKVTFTANAKFKYQSHYHVISCARVHMANIIWKPNLQNWKLEPNIPNFYYIYQRVILKRISIYTFNTN